MFQQHQGGWKLSCEGNAMHCNAKSIAINFQLVQKVALLTFNIVDAKILIFRPKFYCNS